MIGTVGTTVRRQWFWKHGSWFISFFWDVTSIHAAFSLSIKRRALFFQFACTPFDVVVQWLPDAHKS